jgi:Flp pilus assembly protein TadD
VLQRHPWAPAEVRLGLAACYFKAGRMDLAQAAYERCVCVFV